jgi:glycosyltransferase involved in cell wall biosynthesis
LAAAAGSAAQSEVTRLTRIIARLNIGGPAIQAITLTEELRAYGFETHLIRGVEDPDEGNMDYLATEIGVRPTRLRSMRRDPGLGDLRALAALVVLLRRDRPAVVHTHAAKGGTLGRVATLIAFPRRSRRPVLIHTYHGHSLTGYFSGRTAGFYRLVERLLAPVTDRLIAVSDEVRNDLIELRVAGPEKFTVIPLGFDLSPFTSDEDRAGRRARMRGAWGAASDELVVTLVARLVPIKRVDRFLAAAARVSTQRNVRFVVVGDGELRQQLEASDDAAALGDRLVWAGFRRDIPDVCFASDLIVLTSDNEGTPVSLIEAQAAAVAVVATDVGGVRSVVLDGRTGLLSEREDVEGLALSVSALLDDDERRTALGADGRAHVSARYTLDRLVRDHAELYRELLAARS